jgi:hypothetical protein
MASLQLFVVPSSPATSVRATPEDDGSHILELANGSIAAVPADQIPAVIQALQWGLAQRVFAQSKAFAEPTDANVAFREFHMTDVRTAARGRSTNLACNLSEFGWVVFLGEDAVLRQLREKIDRVLMERSASSRAN